MKPKGKGMHYYNCPRCGVYESNEAARICRNLVPIAVCDVCDQVAAEKSLIKHKGKHIPSIREGVAPCGMNVTILTYSEYIDYVNSMVGVPYCSQHGILTDDDVVYTDDGSPYCGKYIYTKNRCTTCSAHINADNTGHKFWCYASNPQVEVVDIYCHLPVHWVIPE